MMTHRASSAAVLLRLVAAAALASCVASITTPVGTYTPSVDVTQQLDVSKTVNSIVSDLDNLDFTEAKTKYNNNAVLSVRANDFPHHTQARSRCRAAASM